MKAILCAAALLGFAAAVPAQAGEGQGGTVFPAPTPAVSTHETMKAGGIGDPFSWSATPTQARYSEKVGGIGDPFSWSATPIAPATQQASAPNTASRHG